MKRIFLLLALAIVPGAAVPASAQTTALFFDSQPGDAVGQGQQRLLTTATHQFSVQSSARGLMFFVRTPTFSTDWTLWLDSDTNPLTAGNYESVTRAPSVAWNGLSFSGGGTACGAVTGRYVVREIEFNGPALARLAVDFEQHCNNAAPGLYGAFRYNSTISDMMPFGGAYPTYRLDVAAPANGRIRGGGVDCGGTATACAVTLGAAARFNLVATPDPGYIFVGWNGDCAGVAATSIHVNGPKRCSASFVPAVTATPRTYVLFNASRPGSMIPRGFALYNPSNSIWRFEVFNNGGALTLSVDGRSETQITDLRIAVSAPDGQLLTSGTRYVATGVLFPPTSAIISTSADAQSCGSRAGEFTIHEITFGPNNTVTSLAMDFQSVCPPPEAPTISSGSIRYNSAVSDTVMTLDRTAMRIAAVRGATSLLHHTGAQQVQLTQSGPGTVTWTATPRHPWLTVSPSSGTGPATLTIAPVFSSSLPLAGLVQGSVILTVSGSSQVQLSVEATMDVRSANTTSGPIGSLDTPAPNLTGVTGALPVTGWALDDVEVSTVSVCRLPTGNEVPLAQPLCGGAPQVFLGAATFVEGARPDVQLAFGTYPRASRAGWGFMLLTNMLPDSITGRPVGGNGEFTLTAWAFDVEGHPVMLGSRAIVCTNAQATKPFGTIDTPQQGAVVSGSSYVNFGWALTPLPKQIPQDGSTITVFVDGAPIGLASYGHQRNDISGLFPGLINSDGAIGYRFIDTTALVNGLHTIAWSVTDSAGVTEGIGSRFFTVSNLSASVTAAAVGSVPAALDVNASRVQRQPLIGRRGWDIAAPWRSFPIGPDDRVVVRGEELDRFEFALGATRGEAYSGFLRVGDDLTPLPIGARLDRSTGAFTWAPGAGFVGTYDFVFASEVEGTAHSRRNVRIVLAPKGSGPRGARVVIDTPRRQQDVAQPFVVAGWAADLEAAAGSGVSGLHAWAYALAGGPPIFLGTAAYGGARPDVAAAFGRQFEQSGFGLHVQGLTQGNYDVALFAWSVERADFLPATTVRLTIR